MPDLLPESLALIIFCAALVGFAKSGLPGCGILVVPLMAMVFEPGRSTGVLLPLLIVGDIFAVLYYRRHAVWKHVFRSLPWAMVGILIGWWLDRTYQFSENAPLMNRIIGGIVMAVLIGSIWLGKREKAESLPLPHRWWFIALLGLVGGFTTMTANAAGPIWLLYLLALNLPKDSFMGTQGFIFLILNVFKVPFFWDLKRLDLAAAWFDLQLIPAVLIGAVVGILILKKIPEAAFAMTVRILTAAAAIKLLMG